MQDLFRNNTPYTVIILFVFALLAKFQALAHPVAPLLLHGHFVYGSLLYLLNFLFGGSSVGYTYFSLLLLFGQALYLNSICVRHKLFNRSGYLPAFFYILLTSLLPSFSYFNEQIVTLWWLLGALDAILYFSSPVNPRRDVFNAGFLFSMAAVVQFSALFFILMLLAALVILRPFDLGEYSVGALGYITPVYFLAGILFVFDRFGLLSQWPQLAISLPAIVRHPLHLVGSIVGIIILLVGGMYQLQHVRKTSINNRRNWRTIIVMLFISILTAAFTQSNSGSSWLIVIPPVSILAAQAMNEEKRGRFSSFIFYFSLAFLVYCQVTVTK